MYHGLAGSSSGALFHLKVPTRFPTAGIIASYDQGVEG